MFNLIVGAANIDPHNSNQGNGSIPRDRVFDWVGKNNINRQFMNDRETDWEGLKKLPCLFMEEGIDDSKAAYIGNIYDIDTHRHEKDIVFKFIIDAGVPPLLNSVLYEHRERLYIEGSRAGPHVVNGEFSRCHWDVKDVDLYRFLYLHGRLPGRQRPTVFSIPEHENIQWNLISVMMPFDQKFDPVYACIENTCQGRSLECQRVDRIYETPKIVEDIVSLIDRSRLVVCDCSGKNPNVFYEAGIAHTLGREVIFIKQDEDIPFDVRHLRHITYSNTEEGLAALSLQLQDSLKSSAIGGSNCPFTIESAA